MSNYIQMFQNPRFPFELAEATRLAGTLHVEASYEGGIARWTSNGRVMPADCAEFAAFLGLPVDLAASAAARDAETSASLAAYRANYRGPSAEEMHEMRAAFGEGATVVNVITGTEVKF